QTGVAFSSLVAQLDFIRKNLKFGQQNRRLNCIQPTVYAHAYVMIPAILTMTSDLAQYFGQLVIVGEDGTAIAIAAQGFAGEKTGAGNGAQVTGVSAFVSCPKALCGIFNYRYPVFIGNGIDGVKVSTLAVQAYRNDRFGFWRDACFQLVRVEVVGLGADVYIHRLCPEQRDGFSRGYVSEAGGNDLVTRADAKGHLGNLQRVGAVGHGDAVFCANEGSQLLFQFVDFRSKNVLAVGEDFLNVGIDLFFDTGLLGGQVNKLHA